MVFTYHVLTKVMCLTWMCCLEYAYTHPPQTLSARLKWFDFLLQPLSDRVKFMFLIQLHSVYISAYPYLLFPLQTNYCKYPHCRPSLFPQAPVNAPFNEFSSCHGEFTRCMPSMSTVYGSLLVAKAKYCLELQLICTFYFLFGLQTLLSLHNLQAAPPLSPSGKWRPNSCHLSSIKSLYCSLA